MKTIMSTDEEIIGVSDHGGWALLVTVAGDGTLLDRRRVELVDEGLPKIPHHSEGQALPIDEAVALVERVRVSAERHAKLCLEGLVMTVPGRILGIATRFINRHWVAENGCGQANAPIRQRRYGGLLWVKPEDVRKAGKVPGAA